MTDSYQKIIDDLRHTSDGAGSSGDEIAADWFARFANRLEALRTQPTITRKIFICKHCEGVYADDPVTQCDCLEGSGEDFIESSITYTVPLK